MDQFHICCLNTDGKYTYPTSQTIGSREAVDVAVVGGSSAGIQYADGAAAATPTGTQVNWNQSGTQRSVSLTQGFPVQPGTSTIWSTVGSMTTASVELTRPADTNAYAALDAISNSTSAPVALTFSGVARINGGTGYIVGAVLQTDQTNNASQFRLHLYRGASAPTATNDNAAFTVAYTDKASYLGHIDFPAAAVGGIAVNNTIRLPFTCNAANTNIYGLLQSIDGFTPASAQKINVQLFGDTN